MVRDVGVQCVMYPRNGIRVPSTVNTPVISSFIRNRGILRGRKATSIGPTSRSRLVRGCRVISRDVGLNLADRFFDRKVSVTGADVNVAITMSLLQ